MDAATARGVLLDLYAAAVAGADPAAATVAALTRSPLPAARDHWLVAIGKAATPMAEAAVQWLANDGDQRFAGGIVVSTARTGRMHAPIELMAGDHPVPGAASLDAAAEVGRLVARVRTGDHVLVLVSGGATALIGAPVAGVDSADLDMMFSRLLASGADIVFVNQVRKRFVRWGGGRLGAALASTADVRCLLVSDVAGDDPAAVGSGPCTPDELTAAALQDLLDRAGLRATLPPTLRAHLAAAVRGAVPETPKPGDTEFERVRTEIILSTRDALAAAARRAAALGMDVELVADEMSGDAARCGRAMAEALNHRSRRRGRAARPLCVLWGGETTVRIPDDEPVGTGGRCQELALAAAERLESDGPGNGAGEVSLLAAGTDGRDGSTAAAGAVVTAQSWRAMVSAGLDPSNALRAHDSHTALAGCGALVPAYDTGTNVRDIAIGIVG